MWSRKSIVLSTVLFIAFCNCTLKMNAQTKVKLETSLGNMILLLYDETPLHRDNFIKLIEESYYDQILFHRVISGFMIQAGDPNSKKAVAGQALGDGGPSYTIPAEFNPKFFHKKGALSAARKGDAVNPDKRSSGSQFYIVQGKPLSEGQLNSLESTGKHAPFTAEERTAYSTLGGTPHLDMLYTVFGELIEGFDTLDKIAAAETDSRNRPLKDIRILHATIVD